MRWPILLCLSAVALGAGVLAPSAAGQVGLTTGRAGYLLTLHAVHRAPADARVEPPPAADQEYLIVEVSVQRWGAELGSYAPTDFAVRDDQLTAYAPVALAGAGRLLGEGLLTPGDGAWGELAFELPPTAVPLRLEYTPPPLRDEGAPLTIQLGEPRS
jgi:hypothetical protein